MSKDKHHSEPDPVPDPVPDPAPPSDAVVTADADPAPAPVDPTGRPDRRPGAPDPG
jgi:hypothetical protein